MASSKKSILAWLFYLLIFLLLGAAAWLLYPEYHRKQLKSAEYSALQMQHAQKTEGVNKQRETVEALENDPRTIEKVSREKYRFLKPGETIMLYPEGGEVPVNTDVDM